MTTLTANETSVLASIAFNNFGDGPGTDIWADCINDSQKPTPITGVQLSGTVSSLAKKGLIHCGGRGRDAYIRMTADGIALVPQL